MHRSVVVERNRGTYMVGAGYTIFISPDQTGGDAAWYISPHFTAISCGGDMRYRLVGIPASALLIVLLSLVNASAQSVSTAQINGTVKDQSGGGLPGVTVTVTQTDTGLTRTAVTDETGS